MKMNILLLSLLPIAAVADFKLGIDNCSTDLLQRITNKEGKPCVWGLVTNQTGLDSHGVRTITVLCKRGAAIRAIFAPEHGYHGKVIAGIHVADTVDEHTQIPVLSLYTRSVGSALDASNNCLVDPAVLAQIDGFIIDIQDSGMRHYTYISATYQVMNQARVSNKKVVLLDRPNPLGRRAEGPLVDPSLRSYVSIAPIPVRHGLTIGEFARYCNKYFFNDEVDLLVVPMTDYQRTDGLAKLMAPLSPNIASPDSCKGYSFLGLLGEIDPLDVGVKTADAFCCIALPERFSFSDEKCKALQQLLAVYGVHSKISTYVSGTKNQPCHGVRITIDDINKLKAFSLFLALLEFFKKEGITLTFSSLFNKAVGTSSVQSWFNGQLSKKELQKQIKSELEQYVEKAKAVLIYEPGLLI